MNGYVVERGAREKRADARQCSVDRDGAGDRGGCPVDKAGQPGRTDDGQLRPQHCDEIRRMSSMLRLFKKWNPSNEPTQYDEVRVEQLRPIEIEV